jgi:hypothetical protein
MLATSHFFVVSTAAPVRRACCGEGFWGDEGERGERFEASAEAAGGARRRRRRQVARDGGDGGRWRATEATAAGGARASRARERERGRRARTCPRLLLLRDLGTRAAAVLLLLQRARDRQRRRARPTEEKRKEREASVAHFLSATPRKERTAFTLASSLSAALDTGFFRMMTGSQSCAWCMVKGGGGLGRVWTREGRSWDRLLCMGVCGDKECEVLTRRLFVAVVDVCARVGMEEEPTRRGKRRRSTAHPPRPRGPAHPPTKKKITRKRSALQKKHARVLRVGVSEVDPACVSAHVRMKKHIVRGWQLAAAKKRERGGGGGLGRGGGERRRPWARLRKARLALNATGQGDMLLPARRTRTTERKNGPGEGAGQRARARLRPPACHLWREEKKSRGTPPPEKNAHAELGGSNPSGSARRGLFVSALFLLGGEEGRERGRARAG